MERLQQDVGFQRASYDFAILAILEPHVRVRLGRPGSVVQSRQGPAVASRERDAQAPAALPALSRGQKSLAKRELRLAV